MASTDYFKKQKKLLNEKRWIDEVISKGNYCHICGDFIDPLITHYLNNHHIAGKNNSDITIPVCPNCHAKLSLNQSSWNEQWIEKNNPPHLVFAFMLRGIADILNLIARILRNHSDKILQGEIVWKS